MRLNNARRWTLLPLSGLAGVFVGLILAAVGALANVLVGQPA
jgi:hypothetical protein